MDDSCAVCADALEWVAYGPCGHREVCSTCVVRLRFVLDDRRCCICKTDNPIVFVTKAMGDYTRVITDFSVFPSGAAEGKAGGYWYHEGTQAYFDDVDHYRMIKAMCRLSCSVCDKSAEEEQGSEGTAKRRTKFRSIEQLKGHLFHQHRLFMCSLCLEGRKVFICEQKLYSRSQLNQHISTGDSEVDGSESERGGFMGHPMCEFCRNPFYGDNELYTHMSTEHYTCHICQRQHPGHYDYYKNYDDLETHFRQEHFHCEDEACLAKKFIVFQTEAEMKRHNTIEHGGHMSRSKRNAALQIPTSFRYRQSNEQGQRRGRGRGFRPDQSGYDLSMAIQASLETAFGDVRVRDSSSGARPVGQGETRQNAAVTGSLESLTINSGAEPPRSAGHSQSSRSAPVIEESSFPPLSDREPPEPSSRYAQAFQSSRSAARLGEESFPPLPGTKKSSKPKASHRSEGLGKSTLAAHLHLRSKGSVAIRRSAWSRQSENHATGSSSSASSQIRPAINHGISLSNFTSSQPRAATNQGTLSSSSASTQVKPTRENGLMPPVAYSSTNFNAANRTGHSAWTPNLIEGGSSNPPTSSMVSSVAENQVLPTSRQRDVQTANKTLVERIRAGLGMDADRFAAFRNISAEYRQGQINTWEYLSYVEQFGLSHLVLELAQLCPDSQKQQELIDAYNANLRCKGPREHGGSNAVISKEGKKGKGKGKGVDLGDSSSTRDALADSILDTVRKLHSNLKNQEEEVETLSKDGYRAAKGKLQPSDGVARANSSSPSTNLSIFNGNRESPANSTSSNQNNLGGKQQKKTSKFHRIRLGDGSAAAVLGPGRSHASPEHPERGSGSDPPRGLPVRGVWRNGGGLRLVANSRKNSSK